MRVLFAFLVACCLVVGCVQQSTSPSGTECTTKDDCSPAQCCHPTSCIPAASKQVCNLMCTMECAPDTMDCGQGFCDCIAGKCQAVYS